MKVTMKQIKITLPYRQERMLTDDIKKEGISGIAITYNSIDTTF